MPIKSGRPWVVRTVVGTARQVREQDARASHAARPAPGPSGDRKDARSDWLTGLQSIRVLGSGGSGLRLHSDVVESVPLRSTLRAEPTQVLGYRYRKVLPQTCAEYSAYGLRTASRRPALVVSTPLPATQVPGYAFACASSASRASFDPAGCQRRVFRLLAKPSTTDLALASLGKVRTARRTVMLHTSQSAR